MPAAMDTTATSDMKVLMVVANPGVSALIATRAHPERGEVHFASLPTQQLSVYVSPEEAYSYRSGKVIYNCLLAGRFTRDQRPVKGSLKTAGPRRSSSGCSNAGPTTATRPPQRGPWVDAMP